MGYSSMKPTCHAEVSDLDRVSIIARDGIYLEPGFLP